MNQVLYSADSSTWNRSLYCVAQRTSSLKEIGADAEQALAELCSCWEEENLSTDEKCKNMNDIRQELLNFWQEKRNEGKLHVLMHKVKNLRDEIEVWWEKCFISEDEKQTFEVYKSTNYTSELYDCHVEELKRMKRKFYRNETLFLLIKKYQDTWKCMVNMDNQLYNRDRLFQNRGAQLLQEERDRRAAQKDLPRLEEVIKKETELYEREHGRPFLVYGKCFSDMILHQKEQHKENQKLLKSVKKKCENCAATSDASKMTTSVSKLKRKLVSNTQSPAATQTKQARVTSCDKFASRPAEVSHSKPGQPVRRKLIERSVNVPVKQL